MKVRPVGAEFSADGQTDEQTDKHNETNSRFSEFCKRALKKTNQLMVGNKIISVCSDP